MRGLHNEIIHADPEDCRSGPGRRIYVKEQIGSLRPRWGFKWSHRLKTIIRITMAESLLRSKLATVATWKAPAFLENLAIDAEGAVFVTVYSHNRVDRYDPATGATTTFAEVPAPPMGLAFDAGGVLWMTGGTLCEGPGYIWRVERSGAVRQWCELPDAPFMNGCTMHPNGRTLLVCESASGHILAIDLGPTWPLGRLASGGSTQADRAQDIRGRTGSRSARAGRGSASRDAG